MSGDDWLAGQLAEISTLVEPDELTARLNRLQRSVNQKRRRTHHQMILIYEAGGRCARCKHSFPAFAYDWHHKDPSIKGFSVDRSVMGKSIASLREEVSKCVLLCCMCHREVHHYLDSRFLVIRGVNDVET